jgi:branched-chain amino acid transport system permease protein
VTVGRALQNRTARSFVLVVVLVVLAPSLVPNEFRLFTLVIAASSLITAVGVNLSSGYAGVFSIGHAAFASVGAYTTAIAMHRWDWPYAAAVLLAVVIAGVIGVVTAIPALRLGPLALAITTLLYLSAFNSLVLYFGSVTGGSNGLSSPRSGLTLTELWYLFAALAILSWLAIRNLVLAPAGRAWRLTKRSPQLAQSLGVGVNRMRVLAFVLSAILASLAGSVYPFVSGFFDTETLTIQYAILVLAMVVVGGEGRLTGPIWGVALLAGVPVVLNQAFEQGGNTSTIVYGLILLGTAVLLPGGIVGAAERVARFARRRTAGPAGTVAAAPVMSLDHVTIPRAEGASLEVKNVTVKFAGVRALTEVSFNVLPGTVHGLIGPNGAGKTTLLNCISGFQKPTEGAVTFNGEPLPSVAFRRARRGLSRTFQQPALLEDETILENVLGGVDFHRKAGFFSYLLRLRPATREAKQAKETARQWVRTIGLGAYEDSPASLLSPGQRRQLEIARVLATEPKVLLMDEPAAGLSADELGELSKLIRAMADAGTTVVLVEHHAEMVFALCDNVTVLAAGAVISDGPSPVVREDPVVIAAYLGDELVEQTMIGADEG